MKTRSVLSNASRRQLLTVVVLLIAVILLGIRLTGHSSISPQSTVAISPTTESSTPATNTATIPGPTVPDPVQAAVPDPVQAAATMNGLAEQTVTAHNLVAQAVTGVTHCSLDGARTAVVDGTNSRNSILGQLSTADIGSLRQADQLRSAFDQAMTLSVQADEQYVIWIDDVTALGCTGGAPRDQALIQATKISNSASSAKQNFVDLWNPIAQQYNFPTRNASDL